MANQSWVSLLNPASTLATGGVAGTGIAVTLAASGNSVGSPVTGAATTTSPVDVAQVNPAGFPLGWYAGMVMRVTARGYYNCSGTTGTLTFLLRSRVGNTGTTYVTLASTNGITTGATALNNMQWKIDAAIRCVSVATSGSTVYTQGEFHMFFLPTTPALIPTNPVFTAAYGWAIPMPNASGETAAAVDTSQAQGINLGITSTAAQGTVTVTEWLVEALD